MRIYWNSDKGRYEAASSYEEKEQIKSAGGWRWDPAIKRWWTQNPDSVLRLWPAADEEVQARLGDLKAKATQNAELSKATDAAIEIPAPAGMAFMPFQKAGRIQISGDTDYLDEIYEGDPDLVG